ncbi:MAG: AbrB/MazE/SpoVT family DNA-binding domain-containing protein [Clostridia bacterium]|nr:AbrB/MazE/SpoVT family DNA-binding domain-containing protein [Clostridia bacterium]MBR3196537.1 AbrB/MazE/SpoVT family DNA-binding domain-containing protein [Clostridia bacterium]
MMTAKVFQSGNSQAIRIPKEVQTNLREFYIRKIGDGYILYPVDDPWFPLRLSIGQMQEEFMTDREQPSWTQETRREEF